MLCINVCEFFNVDIQKNITEKFMNYLVYDKKDYIYRIYIGSYFCSQYFIKFNGINELLSYCILNNIKITLVIPVFSQKDLEYGKVRIKEICKKAGRIIDEITVNDIGMLHYITNEYSNYKINFGRLFFKAPRDCRVPDYTERITESGSLSNIHLPFWKKYHINYAELDPTNKIIDLSFLKNDEILIALHMPFCYMTTGNICKFASIHKDAEQKFRPNTLCQMECMHIKDSYSGHIQQTDCDPLLERYGRTVFFKSSGAGIVGKDLSRKIYFAIEEWRKFIYEDTCSGEQF